MAALAEAGKGAISGAAAGSTFGPWGTAVGGLAGGILGGVSGYVIDKEKNKKTETQQKQQQLVDQLIASLNEPGPYSDLYKPSQEDFEKSFAEPARQRFRNQTVPQIQQSFISNGQQYGTPLQDALTRAGVDLDSIINENYMQYLQGNQNRELYAREGDLNRRNNTIGTILGQPAGTNDPSLGSSILQGASNYLTGERGGRDIDNILNSYRDKESISRGTARKGFEGDDTLREDRDTFSRNGIQ